MSTLNVRIEPLVGPGTQRLDDQTVAATAPSGRDIPGLRFMFARPSSAQDGPTALENYEPPEWLKQASA